MWFNTDYDLDPEQRRARTLRIATALIVVIWSLIALVTLPAP